MATGNGVKEGLLDEDLLRQEVAEMGREQKWYLARVLPGLHKRLLLRLKEVMVHLREPRSDEDPHVTWSNKPEIHSIEEAGYLPLVSPQGGIRGFLIMVNGRVMRADITVRLFKFRRGEEHKEQVLALRPMPLPQLEDAYCCAEMAHGTLSCLTLGEDEGEEKWTEPDPRRLVQLYEDVLSLMSDALAHLRRRIAHSFPQDRAWRNREIFVPPLPADLHLDLALNGADITVTAYALRLAKSGEEAEMAREDNDSEERQFDDEQFKRALGAALDGGLYIDPMGMPIRAPESSVVSESWRRDAGGPSYQEGGPSSAVPRPRLQLSRQDTEGVLKAAFAQKSSKLRRGWWADPIHPSHHPIGRGAADEEPLFEGESFIGQAVDFGGRSVEVLEVTEVAYPLPQVRQSLGSLEEGICIARRLIDQLGIFVGL